MVTSNDIKMLVLAREYCSSIMMKGPNQTSGPRHHVSLMSLSVAATHARTATTQNYPSHSPD